MHEMQNVPASKQTDYKVKVTTICLFVNTND